MRVLVVHASKFGSTKAIAERVADVLRSHGLDVTIESARTASLESDYDAYVIGSAVNAGHWLKEASEFARRHQSRLSARPVWLFSSGPIGDMAVRSTQPQPDPIEVGQLKRQIAPREHRVFAGSFNHETADFRNVGLIERTLLKRFMPEGDWRDWAAIESWAHAIARELQVVVAG
jgi:menaquinone-dependent protoporphyrinogen oxidase